MIHQKQFLMNNANAQVLGSARAGNSDRLSVHHNFTSVRVINTRENFHQGGFACTIFAH